MDAKGFIISFFVFLILLLLVEIYFSTYSFLPSFELEDNTLEINAMAIKEDYFALMRKWDVNYAKDGNISTISIEGFLNTHKGEYFKEDFNNYLLFLKETANEFFDVNYSFFDVNEYSFCLDVFSNTTRFYYVDENRIELVFYGDMLSFVDDVNIYIDTNTFQSSVSGSSGCTTYTNLKINIFGKSNTSTSFAYMYYATKQYSPPCYRSITFTDSQATGSELTIRVEHNTIFSFNKNSYIHIYLYSADEGFLLDLIKDLKIKISFKDAPVERVCSAEITLESKDKRLIYHLK